MIDKQHVKVRFERAANNYDQQAIVQDRVAERLLGLLADSEIPPPKRVLEIGCCTGLLTARIAKQYPSIGKFYVNDLVSAFKKRVLQRLATSRAECTFLHGDIETIALPESLDLVISSSTFHWLDDLNALFAKLRLQIRPGGYLAFAMYGPDNLREIRAITGIGLDYFSLESLTEMVAAHFRVVAAEDHKEVFRFDDPQAVLHHLRETGVNALQRSVWSRSQLIDFIREYERRYEKNQGVQLTYHPMYIVAGKDR